MTEQAQAGTWREELEEIIENRIVDVGSCDEGDECNCSEHRARRVLAALTAAAGREEQVESDLADALKRLSQSINRHNVERDRYRTALERIVQRYEATHLSSWPTTDMRDIAVEALREGGLR